jgi:hypothetical protein
MIDQSHQRVLDELHPQHTALRDRIPEVYKGFARLSRAAFAPGSLDREAIGVTFLMRGGPATIYGARAYTAFCEFLGTDHA